MKVAELIKELKRYPKDAEVFVVGDWDECEDGQLTDLRPIIETCHQVHYVDEGLDFTEVRKYYYELRTKIL